MMQIFHEQRACGVYHDRTVEALQRGVVDTVTGEESYDLALSLSWRHPRAFTVWASFFITRPGDIRERMVIEGKRRRCGKRVVNLVSTRSF